MPDQPRLITDQPEETAEDDARRAGYRQRLREYLQDPDFRAIEGFPIGEDEDILVLSDPPYYTACAAGCGRTTPGRRSLSGTSGRVAYGAIRPALDELKPRWSHLIAGREGFFLEDKGWSLALHARFADDDEAEAVLLAARRAATRWASPELLRVLGGHKFLEVGPRLAHKGQTVEYVLEHFPWPGALPLYLGDDDKDEEAFGVIKGQGGIAILVAPEPRETKADGRLESPRVAREWLGTLPRRLGSLGSVSGGR